jgi:hypothetical protein
VSPDCPDSSHDSGMALCMCKGNVNLYGCVVSLLLWVRYAQQPRPAGAEDVLGRYSCLDLCGNAPAASQPAMLSAALGSVVMCMLALTCPCIQLLCDQDGKLATSTPSSPRYSRSSRKTDTYIGVPYLPLLLCCRYSMMYGASPFQQALDQGASLALAVMK